MAAQTLVEAGNTVLVIDGGQTDHGEAGKIPKNNFISLRKADDNQEKYFLGENFESIPEGKTSSGAQLTPARNFLIRETEKYLPLISEQFAAIESLAVGGLGGGWGLGCCVFSDEELQLCGLNPHAMKAAYQVVADRIGLSGEKDDATKFTSAHISGIQSAYVLDAPAARLKHNYERKKSALNANGFYLGRPALALLTQDRGDRKGLNRRDMDFYDDYGNSAWRAWMAMNELKKNPQVQHEAGWLVTDFKETESETVVNAIRVGTNEKKEFRAKKLVLAAGPLGTARLVLRSLPGADDVRLPFLCNPYNYTPLLLPKLLGAPISENHIGLAQLSLFHDEAKNQTDVAMASLYSYHSLMLFRLLRETPLNFRDGRMAMRYLLPAIMIAGIHHPESRGEHQQLFLGKSSTSPTGDVLHVDYRISAEKTGRVNDREKKYRSALRKLGAYALKQVQPAIGASVHYAGVLPFSEEPKQFGLAHNGRLHNHARTYVADGSGFNFLPAKGLTLSLMANAHLVAKAAQLDN